MNGLLLPLLHLADSALPVGSFAFSNGLEAAAKIGLVRDGRDLAGYIVTNLEQAASFELPFLNTFHAGGDLARPLVDFDASLTVPEMRRASRSQARGLLRLLERIYAGHGIEEVSLTMARAGVPAHYLPSLGMCLARIGVAVEQARRLHLFCVLRDQVSAAIRLGIVGPAEGHELQAGLFGRCEALERKSAEKDYLSAFRTAPLIDIAQGSHIQLYSRLFQN